MNNKIILSLTIFILFIGFIGSLDILYGGLFNIKYDKQIMYASYFYLICNTIAGLILFLFNNVSKILKIVLSTISIIVFFNSLIFTLIALYSSPDEIAHPLEGVIFYCSGIIFVVLYYFAKIEVKQDQKQTIGLFHKIVRYLLYIYVVVTLALFIFNTSNYILAY